MNEENLDYKKACEDAIASMDKEFLRGAEALYHHLQDTLIGHTPYDAVSLEILKFLKPLRKRCNSVAESELLKPTNECQISSKEGCGERVFPKDNPDNLKCGSIWAGNLHLCDDCRENRSIIV